MRPSVNDPTSLASRFRRKRFERLNTLIAELAAKSAGGSVRILDIGGRPDYWAMLAPELKDKVSIVIMNNEEGELAVGADAGLGIDITAIVGDATDMPEHGDGSFDLAHSNSVIEHVGNLQAMAAMADEVRRVAAAYYVQTPYLWFPIEPHYGVPFFHWLPAPTRAWASHRFKVGYRGRAESYRAGLAMADHTSLVDKYLMRTLFPDGELVKERFLLMVKSLTSIRKA